MPTAPPIRTCYTADDLAERFRVTRRSIHNWTKRGYLPAPLPFIGVPRWDADAFEAWVRKQAEDAINAPA